MAQPLGFLAHFYNALGLSFLSSGLSLALASPQSLQQVRTSPELARPTRGIERSIQSSSGESIGAFSFTAEGVALHPRSGSEVLAPRLEDWLGSPDGRTLVGAGDPSGFELPAELDVLVLRDGKRVARLEDLAPETELAVGENGSVAVVGAAARDPGQPFAAFLDPEGALCFRQALPRGTLGRDPQILGTSSSSARTGSVRREAEVRSCW